jgi:hypothetical protein
MRCFIAVLALVLCTGVVLAEEVIEEFSWSRLEAEGRLMDGKVASGRLLVDNQKGSWPVYTSVLTIDRPKITAPTYALRGEVRYENVEGGYLHMRSHFPDGSAYDTQTQAAMGMLQGLRGSSDWRPFLLPFYLKDDPRRPSKLVLSVVLWGKGKVELGTLRLVQYGKGEDPFASTTSWWTDRTGGLIGGIVGGLFGCLGALIGVLAGRGKARAFVLGALKATAVIGLAALIVAGIALWKSQPYAVWYAPLLLGVLLTVLPLGLLRTVRKRYEQLELRKIEAMDKS